MPLGLRAKQIVGVTALVAIVVLVMSALHLASLARVHLHESEARAALVTRAVYHRARAVVAEPGDAYLALRHDDGLRAILESSIYAKNVIDAAIVRPDGTIVAHSDPGREGERWPDRGDLAALAQASSLQQLRAIYARDGRALEVREPLMIGDQAFGSVRVGVSTLLVARELDGALRPAALAAALFLVGAVAVASALAQVLLRPIHVIRSGLSRLGRGEFGVRLDLPERDEFGELGSSFNAISEQLAAGREALAGPHANPQAALKVSERLAALGRLSAGLAHEVKNPLNAMTIHLELLRQKLAGTGARRSTAPLASGLGLSGPAEPAAPADLGAALEHAAVIGDAIRRLDEVMQGFLAFARPGDLRLQPVFLQGLVEEVRPLVGPEAAQAGVTIEVDVPATLPDVRGDAAMLRQALLNLALNAVQAMPHGGRLRLAAARAGDGRVRIEVADTGIGIAPEHLARIFDLYFTTRPQGSGIGLSMVYRTVQLHDGDIEVQSTPGAGTTFTLTLPAVEEA